MSYQERSEEDVKEWTYLNLFSNFKRRTLGKIDFAVYEEILGEQYYHLWAEAKRNESENIYDSFVQLLLTVGKDRTFTKITAPRYFGAFDNEKIGFIEYAVFRDVFNQNDFNWTVAPSDHTTKEFDQLKRIVLDRLEAKATLFMYEEDKAELKAFIEKNFVIGKTNTNKILIDDNTFPEIFQKWYKEVFPTIEDFSDMDVMAGDFFLADLMDKSDLSFQDKLRIVLRYENDTFYYRVKDQYIKKREKFKIDEINLGQKEYVKFWNKYERPPLDKYIDKIITRRDLLVLPDVRERKGSFFTPQIWARLSKDYLRQELGNNWQEEYYIWDCCAGTGNLLFNLTEGHRIYASTLDEADVLIMKECLTHTVPKSHIFQFDFLNDDLQGDKMPDSLKEILKDPEKRKRLIIYINPPYAEADARIGRGRSGVATSLIHTRYDRLMGYAKREIFIQFFTRIYEEIRGCVLAEFSKLKLLQAPAFKSYRDYFNAKLLSLFLVPANTFDNVTGQFPIGFFIWDTGKEEKFTKVSADYYDKDGNAIGKKQIINYDKKKLINDWIKQYKEKDTVSNSIATIIAVASDFQNKNLLRIVEPYYKVPADNHHWQITASNLIASAVYFSVRHSANGNWLSDRDQFLHPKRSWKKDSMFISNCLIYTIFNGQNRISIKKLNKKNHWIPFSEKEVGAADAYESHLMIDFLKGKTKKKVERTLEGEIIKNPLIPESPLELSEQAEKVMDAGRELWRYYHKQPNADSNASYYDIKRHFQGVEEKSGKMKSKSEDEEYERLHDALKSAMKELGKEIEAKVYEYGFLLD